MPQTIAEKIFAAHEVDEPFPGVKVLRLDAVFCHEITTPIAIADLEWRGKDRVFDPTRIKAVIDHVTPAKDTKTAIQGKILRDWARRHNIADFFDVGANGVCHALFPEKGFVRPGYTIIMGDSHTCTHGAFGAFAAGVGTTDLEVGILKGVCAFRQPRSLRLELNGTLPFGVFAKDVALEMVRRLTVSGATDMVIEFHGPVAAAFDMEERMTLCNMAIEAGATCGICQPDEKTAEYLRPFLKAEFPTARHALEAWAKWRSDPDATYEGQIAIDVSQLEPLATVGYKPDEVKPLRLLTDVKIDQVYIGSCTNGRISDLRAAAGILKGRRLAPGVRGIVSPATPRAFREAMDDGTLRIFLDAGFCVTNPTCGACLGMSNGVLAPGEVCAATTNRNFYGRMGEGGMVHLMSPASAAAAGVAGHLCDPREMM
ncbi:MAG: 3-isopropylmalate dehydratase large subunit [Planctomycetota bacterium]|nr:3-isopropylmalate dehydratase large subunit [Planctomycetota bacterium]